MKQVFAFALAFFAAPSIVSLCAQTLKGSAPAFAKTPAAMDAAQPLADRRKALERLFDEQWQDSLKHNPEFASSIGD